MFPAGGLNRKNGFQAQPPFTTSRALNVWPDDVSTGRTRGGRRPGLTKALATELPDAIRFFAVVNLSTEEGYVQQLVCSAGGQLYRRNNTANIWEAVSTSVTIADDRLVQVTVREQNLIIADWGVAASGETLQIDSSSATLVFENLLDGTDGEVDSDGVSFTATSVIDWFSEGVEDGATYILRVLGTGTGTPDVYVIDSVSGDTLTLSTSPGTSITGVHWQINKSFTFAGVTSHSHRLEVLGTGAGTVGQYAISGVNSDIVTLTSAPGATSLTGIHFRFHRAPKIWDLLDDTVDILTKDPATDEPVPLGCNLVCTHNDRIFWAGDLANGNRWYASRSGNHRDYEYGQDDASTAIRGTEYRGGQIGRPITCLMPHNEDCLIFGAIDSMFVMRGDAAGSGYISKLSDQVGPISAQAWCSTPSDEKVFLTRDGVYMMPSGCGTTPISVSRETLPNELLNVDADVYDVLMGYDLIQRAVQIYVRVKEIPDPTFVQTDGIVNSNGISFSSVGTDFVELGIQQGDSLLIYDIEAVAATYEVLGVFRNGVTLASPHPDPGATGINWNYGRNPNRAYWIDWQRQLENGSRPMWKMSFATDNTYPTAVGLFMPYSTQFKSPLLLGTMDGRTLHFDRNEPQDDEEDFTAYVHLGPIRISQNPNMETLVNDGRLVAAEGLSRLRWRVAAGKIAEISSPGYSLFPGVNVSETFQASEYSESVRVSGSAMTIEILDEDPQGTTTFWSFEELVLTLESRGLVR